MAKTFFTADLHLQHGNMIIYAKRPWLKSGDLNKKNKWISKDIHDQRVKKMNSILIKAINYKSKKGDTIYHIGDFCFKGGKEASGKRKAQEYESKINAKIIHILGNHDRNNSVKGGLECATIKFANKIFYLVHIPPTNKEEIPSNVDAVLCGHVHNAWKYKFIDDIPVINIGIDVWNYNLVSSQQVAVFYDKIIKEKGNE